MLHWWGWRGPSDGSILWDMQEQWNVFGLGLCSRPFRVLKSNTFTTDNGLLVVRFDEDNLLIGTGPIVKQIFFQNLFLFGWSWNYDENPAGSTWETSQDNLFTAVHLPSLEIFDEEQPGKAWPTGFTNFKLCRCFPQNSDSSGRLLLPERGSPSRPDHTLPLCLEWEFHCTLSRIMRLEIKMLLLPKRGLHECIGVTRLSLLVRRCLGWEWRSAEGFL